MPPQSSPKDPLDEIEAMLTAICNDQKIAYGSDFEDGALQPKRAEKTLSFALHGKPVAVAFRQAPASRVVAAVKQSFSNRTRNTAELPRKRKREVHAQSNKRSVKPKEGTRTKSGPKKQTATPLSGPPNNEVRPMHEANVVNSSDEADNVRFLHEMKRLTQAKRQSEKRKEAAFKTSTLKRMQDLAAKSDSEMRQVAGNVSKSISKSVASQKKALPRNVAAVLKDSEHLLAKYADDSSFLVGENSKFDALLVGLEAQLLSKRTESLRTSHAKENKVLDSTARIASKAKRFTKVLNTVERSLQTKENDNSR